MPESTLVNAELLAKIIVSVLAIIGVFVEVWRGYIRGVISKISHIPDNMDEQMETLNRNQEQIIDQQGKLADRVESVETGVEVVGEAVNKDKEVEMDKLRAEMGSERPASSYLRGGRSETPSSDDDLSPSDDD